MRGLLGRLALTTSLLLGGSLALTAQPASAGGCEETCDKAYDMIEKVTNYVWCVNSIDPQDVDLCMMMW